MKRVIILGREPYHEKASTYMEVRPGGIILPEPFTFNAEMIIGIEWKSKTRGMLVEIGGEVGVLNANTQNLDVFRREGVSEYMASHLTKKNVKRVIIFKSKKARLKWFAKKPKKKKRKQ